MWSSSIKRAPRPAGSTYCGHSVIAPPPDRTSPMLLKNPLSNRSNSDSLCVDVMDEDDRDDGTAGCAAGRAVL